MSIEKLDFETIEKEEIPYVMICTKVVQSATNHFAIFVWVYLQSLSPTWKVNKHHLKKHFNVGYEKIERSLSYLNRCGLIEYIQPRNKSGTMDKVSIKVLNGSKFNESNNLTTIPKNRGVVNSINNNQSDILTGTPSKPGSGETGGAVKQEHINNIIIRKDNKKIVSVVNSEIDSDSTHTQPPNFEKLKAECLTNQKCLDLFNLKFSDRDITIDELHEECVSYYMLENKFVSWRRFLAWIRNEKPHSHLFKPTEPVVIPKQNNNPSAIEKREIEIAQDYKHALSYPKFMDIYFQTTELKEEARLIYERLTKEAEKQKSKTGTKSIGSVFSDVISNLKSIGGAEGCPA